MKQKKVVIKSVTADYLSLEDDDPSFPYQKGGNSYNGPIVLFNCQIPMQKNRDFFH